MTIITIARNARAALIRQEQQSAKTLKALHKQAVSNVQGSISSFATRMQTAAAGNGGKVPISFTHKMELHTVITQIKKSMEHFGASARTEVIRSMQSGSHMGAAMAQEQLKASVPKGYSYQFKLSSPSKRQQTRYQKVYDNFNDYGDEAATAATDAIRQGVIAGRSPLVIARDLVSSLDYSLSDALITSRTEAMYALRDASIENYRANDDVVDGWIWLATPGCCAMCEAMQGSEHGNDEDMDSHNCCRCTPVPKTKSWADIFAGIGIDASNIPDTTVQVEDGSAWFAKQSADYQRDILGPAKYNAYQKGDLALSDLVGTSHDGTWGSSRYEKSLKDLGLNAQDYLNGD